MLREEISGALKVAIKSKDACATSTLRLINAAIKDRDIAAREKGNHEGISDDEILGLLQSMIKQRQDSIKAYTEGNRKDLADQEAAEIEVIKRFLPEQMDDAAMAEAVEAVIQETGAATIKDMGKCMGVLKAKYAGRMDFGKASGLVKAKLV